jgi:hypothetical protein
MLFTNRIPPVKKSKVKTTGGGGGTLVYQTKVQSNKRTRYSDTVEKQIQRTPPNPTGAPINTSSSTVYPSADKKTPVAFGLRKDAVQMKFIQGLKSESKSTATIVKNQSVTTKAREKTIPKVPPSTDPGVVKQWIESCVQSKVSKISTPSEIIQLINQQVDAKISTQPKGISLADVEKVVQQKMPTIPTIPKVMSPEEIDRKIQEKIPKPVQSISLADVEKVVQQKMPTIPEMPKVMSPEEIDQKIQEKIPKPVQSISLADVEKVVQQKMPTIPEMPKVMSPEEIDQKIVQKLETLPNPQNIVESYVQSKLQDIPTQKTIEELVEKYLETILRDTPSTVEPDDSTIIETAKSRFEELIEPAVGRIVQRIIQYEYQGKEFLQPYGHDSTVEEYGNVDEDNDDAHSINLDIQYGEVYDNPTEGQFDAPIIETPDTMAIENPLMDRKKRKSIIEAITNPTPIVRMEDTPNFDMSTVYQKEDKVMYENELRSEFRSSRKWVRLGNGIEKGSVLDVAMDRNNRRVYIVGHFKHVNRVAMENIAVYDITIRGWSQVGGGISGLVTCIAIYEKSQIIFVGGLFSKVGKGDEQVQAINIAAYYVKQKRWAALGGGLNRECSTLYFDESTETLYAGGSFTQSGTAPIHYVGLYDLATDAWSGLKNGELNGPCRTLCKVDKDLYLGGLFTHAGMGHSDIHVSYVARYSMETNTWSSLSGGLQGYCNALAYDAVENAIYVGGTFTSVGDREHAQNAHHIAKYYIEHQKWDVMGGGVNNVVNSLCFDSTHNSLFVGGTFTALHEDAGTTVVNRIANYIPYTQKWQALPNHFPRCKISQEDEGNDNVGLNGVCKVLSMDRKSLFIAGSFQIAGNITANSIVRYVIDR